MGVLLLQLFNVFAPIVSQLIQQHQVSSGTSDHPTNEQMAAMFQSALDSGDAEAAGWFASHPKS